MITKSELEYSFFKAGADKFEHGYAEAYSKVFESYIPNKLLEIGVNHGYSMKAWRDLLPDSIIVGMEISDSSFFQERYKTLKEIYDVDIVIGDSTDVNSVDLLPNISFDIIIDDGSHFIEDQKQTFLNFKDRFNKFYIIEDFIDYGNLNDFIKFLKNQGFKDIKVYNSDRYFKYYAGKHEVIKNLTPSSIVEYVEVDLKIIVVRNA